MCPIAFEESIYTHIFGILFVSWLKCQLYGDESKIYVSNTDHSPDSLTEMSNSDNK